MPASYDDLTCAGLAVAVEMGRPVSHNCSGAGAYTDSATTLGLYTGADRPKSEADARHTTRTSTRSASRTWAKLGSAAVCSALTER